MLRSTKVFVRTRVEDRLQRSNTRPDAGGHDDSCAPWQHPIPEDRAALALSFRACALASSDAAAVLIVLIDIDRAGHHTPRLDRRGQIFSATLEHAFAHTASSVLQHADD